MSVAVFEATFERGVCKRFLVRQQLEQNGINGAEIAGVKRLQVELDEGRGQLDVGRSIKLLFCLWIEQLQDDLVFLIFGDVIIQHHLFGGGERHLFLANPIFRRLRFHRDPGENVLRLPAVNVHLHFQRIIAEQRGKTHRSEGVLGAAEAKFLDDKPGIAKYQIAKFDGGMKIGYGFPNIIVHWCPGAVLCPFVWFSFEELIAFLHVRLAYAGKIESPGHARLQFRHAHGGHVDGYFGAPFFGADAGLRPPKTAPAGIHVTGLGAVQAVVALLIELVSLWIDRQLIIAAVIMIDIDKDLDAIIVKDVGVIEKHRGRLYVFDFGFRAPEGDEQMRIIIQKVGGGLVGRGFAIISCRQHKIIDRSSLGPNSFVQPAVENRRCIRERNGCKMDGPSE